MTPSQPIRIAVSNCLLGENVRWDGGHKRDAYLTDTLAACFQLIPVCPETAIGLRVPRQPIHLTGSVEASRAVGVQDALLDVSDALRAYGRQMAQQLADIGGYIFKNDSPSCGMRRVKIHQPHRGAPNREPIKKGVGLYAAEIMAARPELPCEEEGRLRNPALRENFIERVFAYHRWRALLLAELTPARLSAFHARHRLALMAHGAQAARSLDGIVKDAGKRPLATLGAEYGRAFMATLRRPATRRLHAGVLHHLLGYAERKLDGEAEQALRQAIDAYRRAQVPLIVPLTLLRRHFRRHPHPEVEGQTYLEPSPRERMLREGI